ncbi:hypothetical protein P344_04175 [Spiroplasma mirum ATCC 29335]|uniref:DUF5673 domain-containing protein n=1 Tax=Spiroplasma mirum ATCC 29335 TaxID=838561 RepID=W0GLT3_9MOLU|nr:MULTISPECIES: hypothetical protein [Spiroplasma]AHF61112.1 hypothetical protein SMM_0694 [Spiroplasma mirum ATCC 29335]AHI58163.1 hypothetical protein P344_04175 [Spiroplasma mirum ATCC 29335]AKM53212.1 hypothetical protein SATRI_v1c07600 [Spiroplasma atrichopogonis]
MLYFNAYLDDQKGLLIALAMATFLFVAVSLSIVGYLVSFNKRDFTQKFINKKVLIFMAGVLALNIPILVINYVFGFAIDSTNQATMIVLIVIAFAITIIVGIYIFFFLQTIAIGIDDKEIAFLGERILIRKITKVEQNNRLKQIIIYYTEGSRSKKKCKFLLASQSGQFVLNNLALLNQHLLVTKSGPASSKQNDQPNEPTPPSENSEQ